MLPATTPTRRARRRDATLADIREAARALLHDAGADAVTLRGIAARLGMAPAGVHYYFASRDELLTALIIDAFDEIATTIAAVEGRRSPAAAWTAGASAYRSWALQNPNLFLLAHSATAARLKDRPGLLDAKDRAARALIEPLAAAIADGQLGSATEGVRFTRTLRDQLRRYADATSGPRDPRRQLLLLQAYTLVHGAVVLAVTGGLPRELLEDDSLFQAQLAMVLRDAGAP